MAIQRFVKPFRSWLERPLRGGQPRLARDEVARLEALTVPMAKVTIPMTAEARRIAWLLERLGSTVLWYGYGRGEALAVALSVEPDRVEPLIAALRSFSDDEILGVDRADTHRMQVAVTCRNELTDVVADIVRARPKPGAGTNPPRS